MTDVLRPPIGTIFAQHQGLPRVNMRGDGQVSMIHGAGLSLQTERHLNTVCACVCVWDHVSCTCTQSLWVLCAPLWPFKCDANMLECLEFVNTCAWLCVFVWLNCVNTHTLQVNDCGREARAAVQLSRPGPRSRNAAQGDGVGVGGRRC